MLITASSRKPHKPAFYVRTMVFPIVVVSLWSIGAGVAGTMYLGAWLAGLVAALWLCLVVLVCLQGAARYRKEQYHVHADRIVLRRGGLFSDEELEVRFSNITHVKWIRPWLRHRLFGVGEVRIEVAGSGAGTIAFLDLADSAAAQQEVREQMKQSFSMSTDELLHEERPARRGILLNIPMKLGGLLAVVIFAQGMELLPVLSSLEGTDVDLAPDVGSILQHAGWLLWLIPVLLITAVVIVLEYLDVKRRVYRVYSGVIEYHEGFLSRNDAFIPVENLSNSEVSRGVTERLTQLHKVVLSCQGAGQEVHFDFLRQGPALKAVLDRLISSNAPASPGAAALPVGAAALPVGATVAGPATDELLPPVLPGTAMEEQTYRMHIGRTLAGAALFFPLIIIVFVSPFLLIWFAPGLLQILRMLRTTYTLRQNSVEECFAFIRVQQREFSNDKITGVYLRENLLDRLFGTITIQFWSIGAGQEIAFRNVRKSEALLAAARARAGGSFDHPQESIRSEFRLRPAMWANVPVLILLGVLIILGGVLAAVIHPAFYMLPVFMLACLGLGYVRGRLYYPRSILELHADGLLFRHGVFIRTRLYACYENIKDSHTVKIPTCSCGSMRFNVAGERIFSKGIKQGVPYGFTMRYVPDILSKDEWFDYEVLARSEVPNPEAEPQLEAGKALKNTALRTLLISTILFPLFPLLPLTLPIALWRAHLVRYRIESGRVLMQRGRFYRSQSSILFSRIDHIQTGRGPLNKMFGNGNIVISTAGSSRPELVLRDVKEHDTFYKALQDSHLGGGDSGDGISDVSTPVDGLRDRPPASSM